MERGTVKASTCCPPVDPSLWGDKEHVWQNRTFIKDSIPQIFHIPLPWFMNQTMSRMWQKAQGAATAPNPEDFLILAYDPSPWKSEFYMTVTGETPGAENVRLSGTFRSRVFDGPYNAVPKWLKEMDAHLTANGQVAKKYYIYFTTCPKCAKIYGHNYVVVFAQVQ